VQIRAAHFKLEKVSTREWEDRLFGRQVDRDSWGSLRTGQTTKGELPLTQESSVGGKQSRRRGAAVIE